MQLQVAFQRDIARNDRFGRGDEGGDTRFHVNCAAPIELAGDDVAAPGIVIPAGKVADGHDIDMAIECQTLAAAAAGQQRHQIRPPRFLLPARKLQSALAQPLLQVILDLRFFAVFGIGHKARIDALEGDQVLRQPDDVGAHRVEALMDL